MGSKRYFNPQHASPSYEEMGQVKPKKRPENMPLPIKYVVCYKCKSTKNTLLQTINPKTGEKDYICVHCQE